jgi:hypothetical protein
MGVGHGKDNLLIVDNAGFTLSLHEFQIFSSAF